MLGDKKVFIAEVGVQYSHRNMGSSIFMSGTPPESILVIAKDYNQAASKVEAYLENMPDEQKESILDADGSLKNLEKNKLQLLGLKVTDTKIIW